MELEMQPNKHKIKVGARYINKHTNEMCTVTSKLFFNVEYRDDDGFRLSIHYETFKKNWIEMSGRDDVPQKCRKCGLDCGVIGGSQWLEYACEKENRIVESK